MQISRIDSTVPLSIVRCGSPSRIARPANGESKMIGASVSEDRLTLYGSFTSSSSYKPMLYLALAGLPFSFRTVNLKIGVQSTSEYLAINRSTAG
jgi:hypothetical protein